MNLFFRALGRAGAIRRLAGAVLGMAFCTSLYTEACGAAVPGISRKERRGELQRAAAGWLTAGIIAARHIDPDYRQRMETDWLLGCLREVA